MEGVYIIGIDLAKHSFQLHGAGADGSGRVPQEVDAREGAGVSVVAASLRGGDGGLRERALLGA